VVAHAGVFRVLGAATRTGTNAYVENATGRRIMLGVDGISDNGPAFESSAR
jgi:hypothetical protein